MPDAALWSLVAVLVGASEVAFASRRPGEASIDAIAMDHAVKAATTVALAGPVLLALVTTIVRPLPAVMWCGFGIAVAGVTLRSFAMITLRQRYRLTPQRQSDDHYLMSSGVYSLVRHPGYAGILVALSGMALIASGPAGLLALIPVAALCIMRIAGEERLLEDEFGAKFRAYCRSVCWRLVPCLY